MNNQPPPIPTSKTSGLAIASLVLGLLGLTCILPLLGSILGIIFGIVALNKIKHSGGALTGQGPAITGIVTGAVSFVMLPMLAAMLLPALSAAREKARTAVCAGHMRVVAVGCIVYADRYGDTFPESLEQLQASGSLPERQPGILICPSAHEASVTSYSLVLAGRKLSEIPSPATTPLLAEHASNHRRGVNVAYADGHVAFVPTRQSSAE